MATDSKYGALGSKKNLNKLLSKVGAKPLGGGSSSNNKPSSGSSSNPYGQFGSMENLTNFVNSVQNVPDSDVATINKNLKKAGIQNFNYTPTQAIEAQTVADMTNMTPIPFQPTPTPDANAFNSFATSALSTQDLVNQESAEQKAWNQKVMEMQSDKNEFVSTFDLSDKYQDLQKDYGVPELTKQLQQENLKLTQMQNNWKASNMALEQQAIPQPFVIGQQNELAKTAALEIGAQAAIVSAYQGNLELANHYVDKMIDLEAKDYENKYNAYTDNINLAMDFLDRADKKQAQAIQYELDIKKQEHNNMLSVKESSMKNALLNNAPASVTQAIQKAQTTEEVYSAAGRFAVDPTVQAQLQTERLQQQKLLQEINGGGASNIADQVNAIFQNKEANTPVIAKQVLAELMGSDAVSTGTRGRIAPAIEVLNAVDEFANANLEGKFIGSGGFLGFSKLKEGVKGLFNKKNPEAISNAQQIEAINLKVQQWASGAALTEAQTKQVEKFTPSTWDSDKEIRTKTSQLYNFMLNQAEGNLLTEGINVQFPAVDLFEIQKLYQKASPEQKKIIEETYFNK